jgi:hypothetical protein
VGEMVWPLSRKLNADSACKQKSLETPEFDHSFCHSMAVPFSAYTVKICKNNGATYEAHLSSINPNAFRKSMI